MSNYLSLIKSFVVMKVNNFFAYRFAAFARIAANSLHILIQPFILFLIYSVSNGVPGWSFYELLFFEGTANLAWGFSSLLFFPMVWYIGWRIDEGYFDQLLLRPVSIIPQMIIESINIFSLPDIILGFVFIIISLFFISFNFTIVGFLAYVYLIFLYCIVMFGLSCIIIGLSFKFWKTHKLMNLFWEVNRLADEPLNIYKAFIPFFMTFILPLALANYYPAGFFLGKLTDFSILLPISIVSIVFALIGHQVLKWGLRHYTSAGG